MREQSFSKHDALRFAGILIAAILLFWWRIWALAPLDRMHFTDDIFIKDYPTRLGLYRTLLSGSFPFWDMYQFGGWPGIANCEAGFFYPFNWILIPFVNSPQAGFLATQWLVLFHFFIVGMGVYCLARKTGLSPYGAGMAAMVFTFCGFHCAHKKHTNMLFTLVWFPWILLQAEHWLRERSPRFLIRVTLLLSLAYLAGHPQASLYITLFLLARLIYAAFIHAKTERGKFFTAFCKHCFPAIAAVFIALSLTAFQWLPTAELIQQGERASADTFQRSTEFSLPPHELIDTILPEILKDWSQVEVFYWGIIPLLLAMIAWMWEQPNELRRYLIGMGVMAFLLSLGEHLFVYDLSYVLIPGVAWVRAPSRLIYFAGLPIAYFAGRGIDQLFSGESFLSHKDGDAFFRRILIGVTVFLGLLFAILFFWIEGQESDLLWRRFHAAAVDSSGVQSGHYRSQLLESIILTSLFTGFFFFAIYLVQQKKITVKTCVILTIILTWVDLGTRYRELDLAPGEGGYTINEEVEELQQAKWNHRTKVFLQSGGNRTLYHGAAQNFPELDGQSPLTPLLHLQSRQDTALLFPQKPNTALLKLFGAHVVLTDAKDLPQPFERETGQMYIINEPAVHARFLLDEFFVKSEYQRALLAVQSFPYNNVAIVDEKILAEEEPLPSRNLFPKPFLLVSASNEAVSMAAHLVIDGEDHFAELNEDKGYYIASADPFTGSIEQTATFNLMKSDSTPGRPAHHRMLEFIESIPNGHTVFAAIRDNAVDVLHPEGLAALRAIGASLDVRGGYKLAHAIVGTKGAPIGSALEIVSPTEAFVLQTHQNVFTEGLIAGQPKPAIITDDEHAADWFHLLSQLDRDDLPPARYPPNVRFHSETLGVDLPAPVMVFSAPKKEVHARIDDYAGIQINGVEAARNETGYNLVVMNPESGAVEASETFNIVLDYDPLWDQRSEIGKRASAPWVKEASEENTKMRAFIHSVTEGYFILGAIRDEATDLLQPETVEALRQVGSAIVINPENRKRYSHAFVGIKGATQCIEAFRQEQNAIVFLRYPGGPTLMPQDLSQNQDSFTPTNTIQEITQDSSDIPSAGSPPPGKVFSIEEKSVNRLRIAGNFRSDGILFLSEMFYPDWKVIVDGVSQNVERINYYFRGVRLDRGEHEIEFFYSPASFWKGLWISIIALFVLILWRFLLFHRSSQETTK